MAQEFDLKNKVKIRVSNFSFKYGDVNALDNLTFDTYENTILSIIGPAKSGKTTFLRCLNRLNDLNLTSTITGEIFLDDKSIYSNDMNVSLLRKKMGMVFAVPVPLPGSIYNNMALGPRLHGITNKEDLDGIIEKSLKSSVLWEEVKDRLDENVTNLSGGQQQRLCLARVLALEPEVILLDEPCSGLDPISTAKIEEALQELKNNHTVILVTNNVNQAARASDLTIFFYLGKIIEYNKTSEIFTKPKNKQTEDYLQGKFG
ncbi:MAG: phosphate ABC transporter ATP-binding protein [Elusimicrobia bacterium]|nr:phosphate ABC transporter ATP-binding protein [Candidatus Liberimonas magnetica]